MDNSAYACPALPDQIYSLGRELNEFLIVEAGK